MYTPNWLPYDTSRDFLRGSQVQTMLGIPSQDQDKTSWSMNCFGEILCRYENGVKLDRTHLDAWNLPTLKFHFERSTHALHAMIEMAQATGLEIERVIEELAAPGSSIHEVGTARMGHDAKTSVVDAFNRVHGCPNVLVVDGACWPSAGYQNPTLTMVAMAARACDTYLQSVAAGH
jgi:choline dehydrogenase-like flavoprotein